jgi:aerobic-type carbon monoxide dehydrogenase small subunit (CoxS/CutS family)
MDSTTTSISFTVNGQPRTITTDADRPLLEVIREEFGLTGTHFGCGQGDCGACSVLIDGKRAFSCQTAVSDAAGKSVVTIEGLAKGEKLHPVQQAFLDEGAYQCAYCVSGMIIAAVSLLNEKPTPSDEEIKTGMNGNLCRCCGYARIFSAVKRASGQTTAAAPVTGGRP